jgi:hypothetical protein
MAEVDGEFTAASCARGAACARRWRAWCAWAMEGAGEAGEAVARSERWGNLLRVTLDFAPGEALPEALPSLVLLPGDGRGTPVEVPMRWEDEDRVAAEYTLPGSGTWHPVVKLGTRVRRAPPVALPYAPEFEGRRPWRWQARLQRATPPRRAGRRTLRSRRSRASSPRRRPAWTQELSINYPAEPPSARIYWRGRPAPADLSIALQRYRPRGSGPAAG